MPRSLRTRAAYDAIGTPPFNAVPMPLDNTRSPGMPLGRAVRLGEAATVYVAGADEVDGHVSMPECLYRDSH